jgi:hypothetical protein
MIFWPGLSGTMDGRNWIIIEYSVPGLAPPVGSIILLNSFETTQKMNQAKINHPPRSTTYIHH